MGGSDQWGNIVSGADLARRYGQPELFGVTTPLITTKSGAKMGKTASGAIWLKEEFLSAYDYWQFWRNTEDDDVVKFLKLFTEMPLNEINELAKLSGQEINQAKIILANATTSICRGESSAKSAESAARKAFEQGILSDDLPHFDVNKVELEAGIPAFKLFHMSGLATSNGEAQAYSR